MGSAIVLFAAYETFGSALQHGSDAWSARAGMDLAALRADRLALLLSDAARSLGWLAAAALLVAFGLRGRGPRVLLPAALAALVAIDLATVGLRYLGWQRWVEPESIASFFAPRAVDREILADPVPGFRVLDLTVDPFNSARPALHHRIVGGYHAAKLRRMQDLIDHHLRRGSGPVLDMLDVRYRIERGGDGEPIARRNAGALGPAWLVDEIRWVGDSREELQSLADFDPARTAVVHREFATLLGDLDPSPGGRVEVLSHRPDDLLYRVESAGDALLVLSEVWYGPGAGWHAWVDGTPREIVRVNYVLRAVVVPAGRHDIRLAFTPSSFLWGRRIAAASSAALLITSLLVATRALLSRRGRRPGATIPPGSPTVRATGTTPDDG
jgi:hypothetical protein